MDTGTAKNAYSKVDTGIVGLGNIGHYHAERLRDIGGSLVGGMDISSDAQTRFERRYGVPVYDDHQELFDRADAVVITTPNKFHEEYATDALERDLHVLIEKPLAHTLESAERIAAAASSTDSVCVVGFNNRFANTVRILRARIEAGELGELTHVEANYVRRRGVPGRGTWFTRRAIAGGGALIDLGVHAIDLGLYLFDFPSVEEVSGVTRSTFGPREDYAYLEMWGVDAGPEGFDVDDSASAFVRCGADRTLSLEVAWATNRPATHEFVVHGTDAAATFDLLDRNLSIYSASQAGTPHLEDSTIQTAENDTHTDELRAFLEAITTGSVSHDNVAEGLEVQRVVDAIYRSGDSGRTVRLDSDSE